MKCIALLLLLLIGCTSHRVDSGELSFVDQDNYVRPDTQTPPTANETILRTGHLGRNGDVQLYTLAGKPYLRVRTVIDYTDAQVYLATDETAADHINLGPLPKYAGTSTFAIPQGMEGQYQYALLWSRTENTLLASSALDS